MAKSLPTLLTEAREAKGLNKSQAARLLKVTQPAVTQWEAGTTVPSLSRLKEIAGKYGADADRLTTAWLRTQAARPPRRKCAP